MEMSGPSKKQSLSGGVDHSLNLSFHFFKDPKTNRQRKLC